MIKYLKILTVVVSLIFVSEAFAGNAALYKYAPDAPKSKAYSVSIDSADCHVYPTPLADIAPFDITGRVGVRVKSAEKITGFEIRPLSKSIKVRKSDDNTLEFEISQPCNLSVEINGIGHPLFIFANPPAKNVPDRNAKNVKFFEAGKIYDLGLRVEIPSDTTIYIEGGAIVYTTFRAGDRNTGSPVKNIRICGNGILSGERVVPAIARKGPSSQGVEIHKCDGLKLEGFCLVQSPNWSIPLFASQNILIDNIKTICEIGWDDGIDLVSCRNVLVQNCFLRNKDDCIAIKAGVGYAPKYFNHSQPNNSQNITVRDCVLWNSIWGNALEIGFETRGDEIKNIVFENIDIIHAQCNPTWKAGQEGVFTIHNGDRAKISNVLYKNIRVEDAQAYIANITVLKSRYSKDKNRGTISDVRFEDISIAATTPLKLKIEGFSDEFYIDGVSFKNVKVNGKPLKGSPDVKFEGGKFTKNISYE